MEETLITFVTAKLAKEKGFDDVRTNHLPYMLEGDDEGCIGASIYCKVYANCCTQSLLQKWLREVHNIHIEVHNLGMKWWFNLKEIDSDNAALFISDNYNSYEEALEVGLQQALKLIKEI